jgi:hypothetical protein
MPQSQAGAAERNSPTCFRCATALSLRRPLGLLKQARLFSIPWNSFGLSHAESVIRTALLCNSWAGFVQIYAERQIGIYRNFSVVGQV